MTEERFAQLLAQSTGHYGSAELVECLDEIERLRGEADGLRDVIDNAIAALRCASAPQRLSASAPRAPRSPSRPASR